MTEKTLCSWHLIYKSAAENNLWKIALELELVPETVKKEVNYLVIPLSIRDLV